MFISHNVTFLVTVNISADLDQVPHYVAGCGTCTKFGGLYGSLQDKLCTHAVRQGGESLTSHDSEEEENHSGWIV